MARQKHKVEIDGTYFQFTDFDATTLEDVWFRLSGIVAEIVSSGVDFSGTSRDVGMFAIGAMLRSLKKEDSKYLRETLGKFSTIYIKDGNKENELPLTMQVQDEHFGGRFNLMVKWMIKGVEINYSDFLEELKKLDASHQS